MRITISGHIGSGKSTVSSILSNLLGYKVYSGGYFFRKLGEDKNISIEDVNKLAENDPKLDHELNNMIKEFMEKNDFIIVESRLSGFISWKFSIPAFRVFLDAPREVRMERVKQRDGKSFNPELFIDREESENMRYKKYFQFDMDDLSIYDLIVDTTSGGPDQIAKKIIGSIR
ncbi:(d)CMP kinase [Caldiplasma sukawensis]